MFIFVYFSVKRLTCEFYISYWELQFRWSQTYSHFKYNWTFLNDMFSGGLFVRTVAFINNDGTTFRLFSNRFGNPESRTIFHCIVYEERQAESPAIQENAHGARRQNGWEKRMRYRVTRFLFGDKAVLHGYYFLFICAH